VGDLPSKIDIRPIALAGKTTYRYPTDIKIEVESTKEYSLLRSATDFYTLIVLLL
jgi:hypothetical protein